MTRKSCVICGKAITEQFHVCLSCIRRFKIPYKYRDWPRWLKDLVNIEIKNLTIMRLEEKHMSFNISESEPSYDEDDLNQNETKVHNSEIIKAF